MGDIKYKGFNGLDGMAPLQLSQTATANSFKEALSGVGELLKTVEKGYVEDNTLKVQEYLRNNIKSAGLGADAPEIDQIAGSFGKLIDKDAIGKTIISTREKMLADVDDKAQLKAGQVMRESNGDMLKATQAINDTYLEHGAKPGLAMQKAKAFHEENKFMPELIKLDEDKRVEAAINNAYAQSRESGGKFLIEDTTAAALADNPPQLREKIMKGLQEREKLERTLTGKEVEEITFADTTASNLIAAERAKGAQLEAAAKAKVDAIAYSPEGATEGAKKFAAQMGGLNKGVGEDATGSYFAFGKDNLEDGEVPNALNELKVQLLKGGVSNEDADGILFQAYNESRVDGAGGVYVKAGKLKAAAENYAQLYTQKMAAKAEYTNIQAENLKKQLALEQERTSMVHGMRKGAADAKVYGKSFNIADKFASTPFYTASSPGFQDRADQYSNPPQPATIPGAPNQLTPEAIVNQTAANEAAAAKGAANLKAKVKPLGNKRLQNVTTAFFDDITGKNNPAPVVKDGTAKAGINDSTPAGQVWNFVKKAVGGTSKAEASVSSAADPIKFKANTESLIQKIGKQESRGDYKTKPNERTGALGKYQILPKNWPSWSEEAGLKKDAPLTPANQDKVAKFKINQYMKMFNGNQKLAAAAWYAGPDYAKSIQNGKPLYDLNKRHGKNGTELSVAEYVASVINWNN